MKQTARGALLISALRLLPRNAISRLAGHLIGIRLPQPLQRWQILLASRWFGIQLIEVRDPIRSFASFQDFFVRALAPGTRPIDPAPDAIVSPCDGTWGESGYVTEGQLLQIKGRQYSLADLLGNVVDAKGYEGGSFATLYLSPADYHRFHSPCDVNVSRVRYLPGSLWPVSPAGLAGIDSLFAQNERICAFMNISGQPEQEGLCVVAVGATMVGKIRLTFDSLTTNCAGAKAVTRDYGEAYGTPLPRLAIGAEWGHFEFGSTLVMLVSAEAGRIDFREAGTRVRMGSRIGFLRPIAA
ncbi:MAG: phosphatidylserine decarboxylase [Myxococcales bacterium]|nr:phosphatidylserine decarboxylase [Myxococcales bacterium]